MDQFQGGVAEKSLTPVLCVKTTVANSQSRGGGDGHTEQSSIIEALWWMKSDSDSEVWGGYPIGGGLACKRRAWTWALRGIRKIDALGI